MHAKHQPRSELVVAHVGSDWCCCRQIAHPCCCGCCLADLWCRLRLMETLPELSLISPTLHEESPSTCRPLSKARFRMSEWSSGALLFLSLLRRQTCTHTQAHMTVDHHLTVAMTTFDSPIIPKHIADFLKIMCVVFPYRLLSGRQPSEQMKGDLKK